MFDVEQARRRAKELLRAARAGDAVAIERFPVLRDTPKLADAQLAVAREAGFTSWSSLLRREERFSSTSYDEVEWTRVRRVTLVPFDFDGQLVLVASGARFVIPTGTVSTSEHPLFDTTLRIALSAAAFRRQNTHVLARSVDGRHVVVWADGTRYRGQRPHRQDAAWWTGPAAAGAALLVDKGDDALARLVEAAEDARLSLTDEEYAQDNQRLIEAVYLAEATPQGGSGFHGSAEAWRETHQTICDAVERDGTFLDVGCANGHLMESIEAWCREQGVRITAFGVDISAGLVERAKARLPHAHERLWVGDALTWMPRDGRRFDYVHALLDIVPPHRRRDMISHLLAEVVAAGGRLIVSQYARSEPDHQPERVLTRLGFDVTGVTSEPVARAWIDKQ